MWHQRLSLAERRLIGRESAWFWELAHDPNERWIVLLLVLAVIIGISMALQNLYLSVESGL